MAIEVLLIIFLQWLAELGGVFYSVKEKGYSAREKRVTEQEFSRKMEIEAKMAADKEREELRLAKIEASKGSTIVKKPATSMVRKMGSNGVVKKPIARRFGRGF